MKKLIWKYFRHEAIQYRFIRKWFGGEYYFIVTGLPMAGFWCEKIIRSCQAKVTAQESHVRADGCYPFKANTNWA